MIQALIGPVSDLIGKFVEDKDKKNELAHSIATMAENHAQEIALAQIATNQAEAKSGSLFVGGWRPAVGWVCVSAFAYHYVIQPILMFVLLATGVVLPELPQLNLGEMMPVLLGMLGLGGMRTIEKYKRVHRP
jgi:hypothetical protein